MSALQSDTMSYITILQTLKCSFLFGMYLGAVMVEDDRKQQTSGNESLWGIIGHVTVEAGNTVGTDGAPPQVPPKLCGGRLRG